MPSLTLVTITNKANACRGERLLEREAQKIEFLHPKCRLVSDCESYSHIPEYRTRCSSKWFDTDFSLVIEFDSCILNPNAWTDEFFRYDVIGAPWKWGNIEPRYLRRPNDINTLVGNGGFTLRSKFVCDLLSSKYADRVPPGQNEDVFVCQNMREELEADGVKFAPFDVASRFSVEHNWYTGQFGAHDAFLFNGRFYEMKKMSDEEHGKLMERIQHGG